MKKSLVGEYALYTIKALKELKTLPKFVSSLLSTPSMLETHYQTISEYFSMNEKAKEEKILKKLKKRALFVCFECVLLSKEAKKALVTISIPLKEAESQGAILFLLCNSLNLNPLSSHYENILNAFFVDNFQGQKIASLTFPVHGEKKL